MDCWGGERWLELERSHSALKYKNSIKCQSLEKIVPVLQREKKLKRRSLIYKPQNYRIGKEIQGAVKNGEIEVPQFFKRSAMLHEEVRSELSLEG